MDVSSNYTIKSCNSKNANCDMWLESILQKVIMVLKKRPFSFMVRLN